MQRAQRRHGRVHDVDRVGRPERLRENVVDAGAFEDGPDRSAGDDAGTRTGGLQEYDARGVLTLHFVRDRRADAWHGEEGLLRLFNTLGDRGGNLFCLAVADADLTVAVTDDDESGEGEPPATLHDLGHAVDRHDALEV